MFAWLCGMHFWWPKMTGKLYSEYWSKMSAVLIFFGFNFTFFPQFIMGYMGMPRRYHVYPKEFEVFHQMSTLGASIMGAGMIIAFCYFVHSWFKGKPSTNNPWYAAGLEWTATATPPITHNFAEDPVVTREAYDYTEETIYANEDKERM